MSRKALKTKLVDHAAIIESVEKRCEAEFEKSLSFYRERKSALFLSKDKFWENAGQPQRSLAITLAKAGIRTHWYEGEQRGRDHLVVPNQSHLSVSPLSALPGRRLSFIHSISTKIQRSHLRETIDNLGGNPLLWSVGGLTPAMEAEISQLDVFSYFDSLVDYHPDRAIVKQARLVTTQNDHGLRVVGFGRNAARFFPPMQIISEGLDNCEPARLPDSFPRRRMGYFGSCLFMYFDYDLLERFLSELPDWGFVIGGRTDAEAEERIRSLQKYKNFHFLPWIESSKVGSYWKLLDVCLLLYRPSPIQTGAFASKVLESLYFNVPVVGTKEPKTAALEEYFPMESSVDALLKSAVRAATARVPIAAALEYFAYEMNPKHQLAAIARLLQGKN